MPSAAEPPVPPKPKWGGVYGQRGSGGGAQDTPLGYLYSTTIAMWSLCEVPAVLGFVLFAAIFAPAWAAEPSMVTA